MRLQLRIELCVYVMLYVRIRVHVIRVLVCARMYKRLCMCAFLIACLYACVHVCMYVWVHTCATCLRCSAEGAHANHFVGKAQPVRVDCQRLCIAPLLDGVPQSDVRDECPVR